MRTPFVLSHHTERDYGRCVRVAGVHLCARCAGTYPLMFLAIGMQIAATAPLARPADLWIALLLPVPALIDWTRGRLDAASGTNASRLLTGALLGLSLGRTLYLHLRRPWGTLLLCQLGAMAVAFLAVEAIARGRRSDRNAAADVCHGDRSGRAP